MRKYVIGFIAGLLVATTGVVAADAVSLVGKKIQSEAVVTLDGKSIDTAIIVDGKSYAPVRSVAEATGLKVKYERGSVKLETQTKQMPIAYWEQTLVDLNGTLESAKKLVANTENSIETSLATIKKWEVKLNDLAEDASEESKQSIVNTLAELQKGHMKLEAELNERQARVNELEAQIAEANREIDKLTN